MQFLWGKRMNLHGKAKLVTVLEEGAAKNNPLNNPLHRMHTKHIILVTKKVADTVNQL